MKLISKIVIVFVLTLLFSSCEKEDFSPRNSESADTDTGNHEGNYRTTSGGDGYHGKGSGDQNSIMGNDDNDSDHNDDGGVIGGGDDDHDGGDIGTDKDKGGVIGGGDDDKDGGDKKGKGIAG